ncbi:endonuclease/exonuclease/phosphatase family protein [Polaribacter sp.]|uniref:endonuclease/exonuclease/phosphatase family protein n=1 Tax=Polaribacter sp. TaxID=1920175 RepID=UPI003EFA38F9
MKSLSLINKIIYFLNIIIVTLLLFSYFLPLVSPKSIPVFAVLSLLVPILIVVNIIFAIYWAFKLEKHFFLSAIILIIGWIFLSPLFKISGKHSSFNDDVKVMSYNVRLFNHFKWSETKEIPEKIKSLIKKNNPDILLLQENYNIKKHLLSYPYSFIKTKSKSDPFGMAIYSKFPIVNKGSLDLKKTFNNIIFVDVLRKKDTIRVYNVHLQSLHLVPNKENFGQGDSEKLIKNLKDRFKQQAEQATLFLKHEKQWKSKKIVAGDFNNTAYSWVYNQISKDKKDAFIEAGKGFGKSFNYPFPMRIDFILTDESAIINQYNSYSEKYSDHFPIMARVNW